MTIHLFFSEKSNDAFVIEFTSLFLVLTKFRCNNYRYLAIIPFRCHSDDRREEESRNHLLCVTEILR